MSESEPTGRKNGHLNNWLSLTGIFLGCCVFVMWAILLIVAATREHANPYFGVFLYGLVPALLMGNLFLVLLGMLWHRWRSKRQGTDLPATVIDFRKRSTRTKAVIIWCLLCVFIVVSMMAAYQTYHFTESVPFCGLVCHQVMKPEYTTHHDSPHANVSCSECHIGPGASAFVKAKISGLHEVYALIRNSYHRPIDPPVKNLRPARETCRTCHWPEKFYGAVLRTWTYYLPDEQNSPWTIKMLMKTGGGDPAHGHIQGFHWHMEGVNDVEYIATDILRSNIPWVRVTDQHGKVTVYQTTDEEKRLTAEQIAGMPKRRMDCMDCHNRPTHAFLSPNEALDLALSAGRIDPGIPEIKYRAAELLAGDYETEAEALDAITAGLRETYADRSDLETTILQVQQIYKRNLFPEMKVRWDAYPDNAGHKITPGCFRCHDGQHVSESGAVVRRDCEICHIIIAQGPGLDPDGFVPKGMEFKHPEDIEEEWKTERCDSCHTGSP